MDRKLSQKFARAIVPFLLLKLPLAEVALAPVMTEEEARAIKIEQIFDERARKIDAYFWKYDMPLFGYGREMAEAAYENEIDWRLLPAIAVRESTGGKHVRLCKNNPFGWASCRINFESIKEAIEIVAWNLGGGNPNTSRYYSGDTPEKLLHYNGTVIRSYPAEVLTIMESLGQR